MILLPTTLGLTLCEKHIVEVGTQNINLINTFTKRSVRTFPSPPETFYVVAALTDGLGDATITWVAHRPDDLEEIGSQSTRVKFVDRLSEVRVLFPVRDFPFPIPGRYQFTLLAENQWLAHRHLQVRLRESQK
jgi:hypothetical protein